MKAVADKTKIKETSDPVKLKVLGFKEAIKRLETDPAKFILKSFKEQVPFLKKRVQANVPKGSLTTPLAKSVEMVAERNKGKVSIKVTMDSPYAVRVHEAPVEGLPVEPTIEGGVGPKFITRVFETHRKEVKKKVSESVSKGILGDAKKTD